MAISASREMILASGGIRVPRFALGKLDEM